MRVWVLALSTSVALSTPPARAEVPDAKRPAPFPYALRSWAKREGLPGAWVSAILPSRAGYLWLATPDGLVRFDGARFTVFNRKTAPGLPADRVHALHESRDGRLWVGTSRGLATGDARGREAFQRVVPIPAAPIISIDERSDGSLWIAAPDAVWRLDSGRSIGSVETRSAPDEVFSVLRADPSGGYWLGGSRGLLRVDASGGRRSYTRHSGLPSDDVLSLLVDRSGALWIGTASGAGRLFADGRMERVASTAGRLVMTLAEDGRGDVWAGTREGLLRLTGSGPTLVGRSDGLPDEHTRALAPDREGNLWIGTEAGGLARLREPRALVYGTAQGLGHDVVWSVAGGRDGSIWIGTDGGGLSRLHDGRVTPAIADAAFAHETVYALFEDRSGRLWFSTESRGLCSLERGVPRCSHRAPDDSLIRCLIQDRAGGIWVGSSGGLLRIVGNSLVPVPAEDGTRLVVEALHEGPDGVIWVGTSSGLARVRGDVVSRVAIAGQPHADNVAALASDPDGTLWIGTLHAGLQRLRGGGLAFLGSDQGLPSDSVLSIVADDAGRLWISAVDGIFGLRRADVGDVMDGRSTRLAAVGITDAEGLKDRECSGGVQPSGWRAADGVLYFPTIAGVAAVDPRRVLLNPKPPAVLIEGVVADGRRLDARAAVELPPGTRHLEIEYAAPSFTAPERVRFETRLVGLDQGFVPARDERVAHFAGLGPGRYRFLARAANEDGVWGEETATLAVQVRPYFWQEGWFSVLGAFLLLFAVCSVVELRTRMLRRRERELERRVAEEVARVRILKGLLPICAWCRKVRDDDGYWTELEAYVRDRTRADFTHGICPDCKARAEREL